jgi:plasmid stability protein
MVNITLRNIPEELLKRIRIFAARERRSLNSELLIVIEEGLAGRIAGETGSSSQASVSSGGASISAAGREKLWKELCGDWKETRSLQATLDEVYALRSQLQGVQK